MSITTEAPTGRGDWIQTFTGRRFYPLDPRPEDVDPVDIAHALSNLCRFAGHVDRFYSVAEHCVLLSRWAEAAWLSAEVQLEMLLHDATEAYVVDVPRPLKRNLPDYRAIEARVATAIAERFGTIEDADTVGGLVVDSLEVKKADTRILLDERTALMTRTTHEWVIEGLEPLGVTVEGWTPVQAERAYLDRLEELTGLTVRLSPRGGRVLYRSDCDRCVRGGGGPDHDAMPNCRSGRAPHCTCDGCF